MVAVKNLFIFAIGASALTVPAPEKRQASAVLSGLKTINSDTQKLTSAANTYNGGGAIKALPVQQAANTLNNDIKSTTTTANNSPVASDADSKSIIAYVNGTLKPSTTTAINAIINKKTQFTTDGLKSTVCSTLKTTLSNTNTLSDALIAKSSTSQKSAAQSAKAGIAAEIQRGVTAFC